MDVVNETDLDWTETERGETGFRRKKLGAATGGDGLGCSLFELPAGKRSWPYHYHAANEEAFYVLAGEGTVRGPNGEQSVREGDYVVCQTGEDGAHRIINDGDDPLRYLAVSTMVDPDVTVYPDSGKFGVFAGAPPGGEGERHKLSGYYRLGTDVDYWDGEE